ncbi:MAG: LemA family protein, partial [Alphaproteobacteria bacterium]|nr:LemA family protein [Alphaproteobacteria bacterium]
MIFLVILGIIVVALYVIGVYNGLVTGQVQTKEAWSTVDTQLKRRYDLIPNIVETVRGYAKHESKTLENVINARNMAMSINGSSVQKEQHENMLSGALKSIFALSESYPDLKANQNFSHLQQELADT